MMEPTEPQETQESATAPDASGAGGRRFHPNRLAHNLLALAAQVLAGEYDAGAGLDEVRLHNQVMRLWRRVDFEPPKDTLLVFARPEAQDRHVDIAYSKVEAVPMAGSPGPASNTADAACPEGRRHGLYTRQAIPCPTCGRGPGGVTA